MIIGTIIISLITYKTYNQSVRETGEAATFVALPIYTVYYLEKGCRLKPLPVLTHHLHFPRDWFLRERLNRKPWSYH